MEILEKLMDNALEFKHTRQIIFDFMSLEESEEGRRLVFNCRKSKINEISMRNLSKDKEKEVYFLEPKMITSEVVESFLKYDHRVDLEGKEAEALEQKHKDFAATRIEEIKSKMQNMTKD